MITEGPTMSLSAKRESLARIHGRYQRHGRPDTARIGSVEADTVAHCDDSTEGDYVNSLTFTELYSGWTENRAVWNKSADAVLMQLKELHMCGNFSDTNASDIPNWCR